MTHVETTSRRAWLCDEIATIEELLDHRASVQGRGSLLDRARTTSLTTDLAERRRELADLVSGGRIDLRLTGGTVHGHLIAASALADVLQPLKRLLDQLGGDAYVSSRPGSFVLEIMPAPQRQLDALLQRLDPLGGLLADLLDAASSGNLADEVTAAVDDLSLDGIRALATLVNNLRANKLQLELVWVNTEGARRAGHLDLDRAALVQQTLQKTQQERSEYEITGELIGVTLERRRTFQIRLDDGTVVTSLVARDAAPATVEFSIGDRVVAKIEETERRRVGSSIATTSKRLVGLHRP